jgi:hypothetical protein
VRVVEAESTAQLTDLTLDRDDDGELVGVDESITGFTAVARRELGRGGPVCVGALALLLGELGPDLGDVGETEASGALVEPELDGHR